MTQRRVVLMALLVLLAGLSLTLLVSHGIRRDLEQESVAQLTAVADEASLKVKQQLWTYGIALRGGAGFFNGSRDIGRPEWRGYVDKLQLGEYLPGVQGMGFAEWISRDELAAHEARVRAEGFAGYRVHPEGTRDHYSAIVFLEPFSDRNLRAFGYDMYAEPVRRTAMANAAASGRATLSGKVRLVQEDGQDEQAGFLMYFPVYRAGLPVQTPAQRLAALRGWTYSPFRMNDMMAATFSDWRDRFGRTLFVTVYDGGREHAAARLFDNTPADFADDDRVSRQRRLIESRGHHWQLVVSRRLDADSIDYAAAWGALAGGGVISLLLAGLVLALGRTRVKAEQLAEVMTADLRAGQQRLRESKEQLRETEARWKFALEGSDLGVWDWNVASGEVYFSPRWKEMLGYEEHEITASLTEWEQRVHPDDKPGVLKDIQACLDGRVPLYLNEHRLRTRDGGYCWILDRGMVVARDADGKPLRMLGTHADVTHAHEARARIQRLDGLYAALSACNSAIVRCTSAEELYTEVCEAIVRFGGVKMAWVGRIDPVARRVLPVHSSGSGTEYVEGIEISIDADDPRGRGPTGTAARENHAVWSPDFSHNPAVAPWHERAAPYGWIASAALPVCEGGKPVAVFTIYVGEGGWFDEEIRALLEEMASDLSYALDKFEAEAEAQASRLGLVESEQRFHAIVEQSMAGAFIIQDGVLVYVNPRLLEILGHADATGLLGRPPIDIVAPRDRARVGANLRRLAAGEIHHVESVFTALRADGSGVEVGTNSFVAAYRGRIAVIGMGQDLSDRKVAEAQIQRYASQLETLLVQTVGLATTISEMRDPYTAGHERRVAVIAEAIGREMGLDAHRLEGLRIGGYLHDVGKMRVPTEILSKPGRLTPTEYRLIQEHARAGYEVLKDVDFPWPVAQIALQHHERWDGSGYPQGLVGEAILEEARIIAVADVIESMASHRPYRPAIGIEAALAEVEAGSGRLYDPQVVAACLGLFRAKAFVLPA